MAFTLKSPQHSFVQFGLEQFIKSDCEDCIEEISLPIIEVGDTAFQIIIDFDTVLELDNVLMANALNNAKLLIIERDCFNTNGVYTPIVIYDFMATPSTPLTFAVYRIQQKQALLYWANGLPPITSSLFTIEQQFRLAIEITIGSTTISLPSNCFYKSAINCYTSKLEYSCYENSYGFNYCADIIPNIVRLPITISKPQFTDDENIYVKSDGSIQVLKSVTKKEYEGKTDYMNTLLHEKLKIALSHDVVNINSQQYSGMIRKNGNYEIEWQNYEPLNISPAKFKVLATPYYARNSNCMECSPYVYVCDINCIITGFSLVFGSMPIVYNVTLNNIGILSPTNVLLTTSVDGILWTTPVVVSINTLTQKEYSFNENSGKSHYIKITPICAYNNTPATPTIFYYSSEYAQTFSAGNITATSFQMNTGFNTGVTFDVSLDGGVTYILFNQTSTTLVITGLTSSTTYSVVRRMKSTNGVVQVLPPQSVTTI